MNETDTPVKNISDWTDQKKTDRWLVCIAATAQGWLPEQEDDAVDLVTEAVYDAAIAEALAAHTALKVEYGPAKVRTICHDTLFVGFVVRRFGSTEIETLNRTVGEKTAKEGGAAISSNFRGVILWPSPAHLDRLRDIVGQSVLNVLPMKWFMSLGAEGERRAKKR